MPVFNVVLQDPTPAQTSITGEPAAWRRFKLRIKARTKNKAMSYANETFKPLFAIKATPCKKTDAELLYWQSVWRRAYENMPTLQTYSEHMRWEQRLPGSVSVPEFIKQSAIDKMRRMESGHIIEEKLSRKTFSTQAATSLTRILKYHTNSRYGKNRQVWYGLARGAKPRDKRARELLLKLAEPTGQHLALELLQRGPQ